MARRFGVRVKGLGRRIELSGRLGRWGSLGALRGVRFLGYGLAIARVRFTLFLLPLLCLLSFYDCYDDENSGFVLTVRARLRFMTSVEYVFHQGFFKDFML